VNEASAIRLCLKSRDPRGFEFLVQQYRREAYYHAIGFLNDPAMAEDVCQESFAKAYANIPRLESLKAFYPWFYVILKNCCLSYLRSKREHVEVTEGIDESSDPAMLVAGDDNKQSVWRALQKLKPEFREILILKHLQDMSYEAISQILQIPKGTVMSRLYHARKAFKLAFDKGD
jgi:RNA polymerase sigma-70 factor (ECF subfamily)